MAAPLLAFRARQMLDEAGPGRVRIDASSGLDEHLVARLVRAGAPIDGFGVGTGMGVSSDARSLVMACKLPEYAGRGASRRRPGNRSSLIASRSSAGRRTVARWAMSSREPTSGSMDGPLRQVMRGGDRLPAGREPLEAA
jgi:nicotinate phosphoribosyltransferase